MSTTIVAIEITYFYRETKRGIIIFGPAQFTQISARLSPFGGNLLRLDVLNEKPGAGRGGRGLDRLLRHGLCRL